MWSHQHIIVCTALSFVISAESLIHEFGYKGRGVNISCSYDEDYKENEKYFCKNDCGYSDVLITTKQKNKGKYSITDNKNKKVVTITISDLQSRDAGKYWCGVSRRFGKDHYTEVRLHIKEDRCCDTVNKTQSIEEGSVTISCSYDSESVNKLKFFCRGNQPSTCRQQAVITSRNTQDGRFRLSDDRKSRIFTVTISSLTLKDSGSYLCGVQRNSGFDDFTAAELQVGEWCCVKSQIIRETAGHEVTLQCPYPPSHRNNRKFLCKGSQRSKCTDMMEGQSRFLVHSDFSDSFSVKITQLEAGDTGTYWCRSEPGWNVGNYTQFQLYVEEEQNAATNKTLQTLPAQDVTAGFPDAALYSLVAVFGGLLLLSVILVTVFKSKRRKAKEVGVVADGKKLDFMEVQEVCRGEDVYQNHDSVVMRSQQQHASRHFSDEDGDELDYENVTADEDIYCNESFHKFK